MKKTILVGYQAIIILAMIALAGYFVSQDKIAFALIYVLLAVAGVYASRSEQHERNGRKA